MVMKEENALDSFVGFNGPPLPHFSRKRLALSAHHLPSPPPQKFETGQKVVLAALRPKDQNTGRYGIQA